MKTEKLRGQLRMAKFNFFFPFLVRKGEEGTEKFHRGTGSTNLIRIHLNCFTSTVRCCKCVVVI